jgi:hypothetical protein
MYLSVDIRSCKSIQSDYFEVNWESLTSESVAIQVWRTQVWRRDFSLPTPVATSASLNFTTTKDPSNMASGSKKNTSASKASSAWDDDWEVLADVRATPPSIPHH